MVRGLDSGQPIPVTPDYAHFLTPDEIGWSTPPRSLPHARRLRLIAAGLARAFLRGPWEQDGLVARGASVLGRRWRWLGPMASAANASKESLSRSRGEGSW
jgi:hypothetical protein